MRYKGEGVINMAGCGESSYRRFLLGDERALEELVRECSDALVRYAYCYVKDSAAAEDVAADAIATVLLGKKRFADEPRFRAYLYKTAHSRAIDYLRRHRREVPLSDVENVLQSGDIGTDTQRKMRNETVYVCMQALPEQYREVLQLMYFENFSAEDAGKILGKNRKQIYNLHARAKTTLKELLEKEGISREELQ